MSSINIFTPQFGSLPVNTNQGTNELEINDDMSIFLTDDQQATYNALSDDGKENFESHVMDSGGITQFGTYLDYLEQKEGLAVESTGGTTDTDTSVEDDTTTEDDTTVGNGDDTTVEDSTDVEEETTTEELTGLLAYEPTDEDRIEANSIAQQILNATVNYKTWGIFGGTDETALYDLITKEANDPVIMGLVQEILVSKGHDIYEIIRSETSGDFEDVLEATVLANIGGATKETSTVVESYAQFVEYDENGEMQLVDPENYEYQIFVENLANQFRTATHGAGTDEKLMCYVAAMPECIRKDVEAKYESDYADSDKSFNERGKSEIQNGWFTTDWMGDTFFS